MTILSLAYFSIKEANNNDNNKKIFDLTFSESYSTFKIRIFLINIANYNLI
jgi:hypothetical protein